MFSYHQGAAETTHRPASVRKGAASTEGDAYLLTYIAQGQHWAFAVLVRRHSQQFYRVAYRFLGNRSEAEDIVQEAFLKLWEKPAMWQMSRGATFTTWFYRVVVNLCLDYNKKKKPVLMQDNTWVVDERNTHEETMLHDEKQRLIEAQIAALPERQQVALNLCFYEALSNQEAADVMGVKLKALQSLLMRAKTTLQEKLKEKIGG